MKIPTCISERTFRGLLEFAPDAMVLTNKQGEIVLMNSQTAKVFGYEQPELLGQRVEMLLPERFRGKHAGQHRAAYNASPHVRPMGGGLRPFGRRKNGAEFPVEISLSQYVDNHREREGVEGRGAQPGQGQDILLGTRDDRAVLGRKRQT